MFIQTRGPLVACFLNDYVLKNCLLRIWGPPGARGPGARAPMAPLLIRHWVYYGNASSRDIHKVHRIIKQAQKVTQCQCQSIHEIYNIVCTRKVRLIVGDEAHPLHQFYSKLRSGIRFKSMRGRTKRYLTSFVPASITHFNSLCRR